MPSRKIEDLDPRLQPLARAFAAKMAEAQLPFVFTCTYRSQEEQNSLYAQGRTKPGSVVTKVRHSKHTDRLAFDIAIVRSNRATWDVKVDVNANRRGDYADAGAIGRELGLRWGGDWDGDGRSDDETFVDLPHFELAV